MHAVTEADGEDTVVTPTKFTMVQRSSCVLLAEKNQRRRKGERGRELAVYLHYLGISMCFARMSTALMITAELLR